MLKLAAFRDILGQSFWKIFRISFGVVEKWTRAAAAWEGGQLSCWPEGPWKRASHVNQRAR